MQGKIVAQGKLLLRGPLHCTDDPSQGPNYKMKEMTVFLFEQVSKLRINLHRGKYKRRKKDFIN